MVPFMKTLARSRPQGMVLVIVCIFIFVALVASTILLKKISSLSMGYNYEENLNAGTPAPGLALGQALCVLQTGLPPQNPASYAVTVAQGVILSAFQVTYESPGGQQWTVSVFPLTAGIELSALPNSFGGM
jgi:hypothetical protein